MLAATAEMIGILPLQWLKPLQGVQLLLLLILPFLASMVAYNIGGR